MGSAQLIRRRLVRMTDYRAAAREAAVRHNVPPLLFERQINRESQFDPNARSAAGALGIAQFMPATASAFGIDPMDPLAALDAAAAYMDRLHRMFGSWRLALAAYNAGEGNVREYGGVPPFPETQDYLTNILGPGWPEPAMTTSSRLRTNDYGVRLRDKPTTEKSKILATLPKGTAVEPLDDHAWRHVKLADGKEGWIAADLLEDAPAGPVATSIAYNPDFPLRLQIADYACSIRTTQMLLESVGINVDIGTLQDQMVPRYVSVDDGLRDGSGAGIVQMLRDNYGVAAQNFSPASWEGVVDVAGKLPVGLGGHGWGGVGHWVAVRRYRNDVLELGNPGGTGPVFGHQTISRAMWGWVASSWSAVVVTGRT